ncbi:MAG: glycolate oxidase subunit GlcF [Gammaproteobacteria bacterium]|nr:glycolate oxidase subunit GlcF [Gammaproteobacteria bacterium]
MQTNIIRHFLDSADGREAERILRNCVHCGFCTATCPTYQMLNDERDGPRGRIYLIKQFLETGQVSERSRRHLDRCLTCRSCETTCPSGVQYGRLIDIGRNLVEAQLKRPLRERALRWGLRKVLPYPKRFATLIKLAQPFKPLLSDTVKEKIPPVARPLAWPARKHARHMLVLEGCVQATSTPDTNAHAARVLDRLGISLLRTPAAGCCGAVSQHLGAPGEALGFIKRNIDAWWPLIEQGAEAIIFSASGCGAMVREYGHLLRDDADYAAKAALVSSLSKDLSEVLLDEDLSGLNLKPGEEKIAVHCPCTLQHALQLDGAVESILQKAGFNLASTRERHLCCGSAGTYSILQPQLSQRLLRNKLDALSIDKPDCVVTANVGCQMHLQSKAKIPVQHWIELLDP